MREADRRTIEEIGLPGIVLMENAAQGAAGRFWIRPTGPAEGLDRSAPFAAGATTAATAWPCCAFWPTRVP